MLNIKNAYIYNSSFEELLKELKEINKNLIQKRVNLFKKELNKLKYKIVDYWLYCWDYLLINLIKLDEKPRIYIFPFEGKIYCKFVDIYNKELELTDNFVDFSYSDNVDDEEYNERYKVWNMIYSESWNSEDNWFMFEFMSDIQVMSELNSKTKK